MCARIAILDRFMFAHLTPCYNYPLPLVRRPVEVFLLLHVCEYEFG